MKKVVVIGGGTGTFTVLSGLKGYPLDLVAIVSTADDGGSTGILRDEMGVLPPGDVRQALVALAEDQSVVRELFNFRFDNNSFKGHSFGNIFLSALEKVTGSFDRAVLEAGKVLAIKGVVIPVTNDNVHLRALTANDKEIKGEHNIEAHIWSEESKLKRLWLEPPCRLHPLAEKAILQADLIVIAPGSLFTSLIPCLLVEGLREAISKTKAPVAYVSNLMTERGQASGYNVQDFVKLIERYLGDGRIDYVIYNTKRPDDDLLERYKKEMERIPVKLDRKRLRGLSYKLLGANLLGKRYLKEVEKERGKSVKAKKTDGKEGATKEQPSAGSDLLHKTRTLIRHDSKKLAEILYALTVLKEAKKYFK